MIAIIDYDAGNLNSAYKALVHLGKDPVITREKDRILAADHIILPGVGAFGEAMKQLRSFGIPEVLEEAVKRGIPLMGICLGMQLLFEKGYEFGTHDGLGLLKGEVVPMQGAIPAELKIPHMGWNALIRKREHPLLRSVREGDCVYFVHSFYAAGCDDSLIATAEYGIELTAAVAKDNVMGCQFHPEKSGKVGLGILRSFCDL